MEYRVEHPKFQQRILAIRPGLLTSPKLMLDGEVIKGKRGKFTVTDDDGTETNIKFSANFTGVPKISVDGGEAFSVAPELPVYAYVLSALPLTLIIAGGAIGGGIGAAAGLGSLALFRSENPTWIKVVGSLAISGAAGLAYILAAGILHILLN